MSKISTEETLRSLENVSSPDPRMNAWARLDYASGMMRSIELRDLHEAISALTLNPNVPTEIVIQFETAKNLYLYSWFVYRFFPIAEKQALACLEFALREKFTPELEAAENSKKPRKPGLKFLLKYARDKGHLRNEYFSTWQHRAEQNSRERYRQEQLQKMIDQKLDEIECDDSDVEVLPEDYTWDYLSDLVKSLPELRNIHAHGSSMLHMHSLSTMKIVSEAINQLYPIVDTNDK